MYCVSESCLQRQLLGLSQVVEEMNSECVREMEACKDTLLSSGVCDSTTVFQVYVHHTPKCNPPVIVYSVCCRF